MRADNDHAVGYSVEGCKDEPTRPQEKWEDAEVKILENGKKNNNVCELFYDTRSGDELDIEKDGDSHGKKILDINHDCVEKIDPVFFMDKNVTACDLPEIVVCYKENTYHVVKDICVDEGVPVQEKFLFGDKDSVKCSSNSDQCGSEGLMNPVEIKEDNNSKVDDSEFCKKTNRDASDESPRENFADAEVSSNGNKEDSPKQLLNPSETESGEKSKEQVATSENVLTLGDILSREDEEKHLNHIDRPREQSTPQLQDEGKRRSEAESEKTEQNRTSDSTTTSQSQEANKTCNDPETENQKQKYLTKDSYEDEDKHFSRSFGETSFSAAEAVSISGHITYTGPITYSGSLSVRSDASTTSGRSFAFPILQSEWNSSPVRMAKADKRRHKGWRHSFLCCRFS